MDEHTTERGAKPMAERDWTGEDTGAGGIAVIYAYGVFDADIPDAAEREKTLTRYWDGLIAKLRIEHEGKTLVWRQHPTISADCGGKTKIVGRLAIMDT